MFIILFLAGLVFLIRLSSKRWGHLGVLRYLPAPLWCYFLPMIASWLGVIPQSHFIYSLMAKHLLPVCLILLLLKIQIPIIFKLGPRALITMLTASVAIMLGGPLLLSLAKGFFPDDAWMGLGTLAGSWTGGSINMIAVQQAVNTPDTLFSVMIIVDSIVTYTWMGFLIFVSKFQSQFDQWNRSKMEWLEIAEVEGEKFAETEGNVALMTQTTSTKQKMLSVSSIVTAIVFGELAIVLSFWCSNITGFFNAGTWAILIATGMGIALSLTRVFSASGDKAENLGYFLLFLLLTTIGAQADLSGIKDVPSFLLFGFAWLFFMALCLFVLARIFRIPLFFLAAAGQANVGGAVSASIVSGLYRPQLAFVGLLLAVLGSILGTYFGIASSYLMRWVS